MVSNLRKLVSTLQPKQIAMLVAVFVGVVGVTAGSAYWLSIPEYTLLVTDMDAETANSVVSKLKDAKVPYELTDGGRAVRVASDRVDELRLQFASGGLPSAGRIGFEIFDRPAFGATEFLEHVNYRRALEGELARTISTLAEVSSARVHIAMAKESLFLDREQAAKASVVLRLKNNRPLSAATAKAIAGLVSGSVESLRPESVVILDTFGRALTKPEQADDAVAGASLERQQQIERDMSQRVLAMLEPVVGSGRVRVNVAAILGADALEETEERWDPDTVVRSRQTTSEVSASAALTGSAGAGIAGARANLPPPATTATPANPPASTATPPAATVPAAATTTAASMPLQAPGRTSETTNYEVGRVTRHRVSPQGQLARLSVAVVLDDERVPGANGADATTRPWEQEQLQRFHKLVAAAVGFDESRGDQLTVENISFEATPVAADPAPTAVGQQVMDLVRVHWPTAVRGLAIFAIAMFAFFGVLRPIARRAAMPSSAPALAAAGGHVPTVKELEGRIEAELDANAAAHKGRLPVLSKRVAKLANEEPEQLARIVRGWMAEGDR